MKTKRKQKQKPPSRRGKVSGLPSRWVPHFWDDVDGRLVICKEIKDRYDTLVEQTQADSLAKKMLCQRAIFIALQIETLEVSAATGGGFSAAVYVSLVNSLQGILSKLGLDVKDKGVTDLKAYVASKSKTA